MFRPATTRMDNDVLGIFVIFMLVRTACTTAQSPGGLVGAILFAVAAAALAAHLILNRRHAERRDLVNRR